MILCEEDYDYFLELCQSGGKPVNFIPVIDGDLGLWFKKDSLWYSEDLGGVPDADPQRVVVLQGPVSAYHTRLANEPAAEILNNIVSSYCQMLVPAAGEGALQVLPWMGGQARVARATRLGDARLELSDSPGGRLEATLPLSSRSLPSTEAWLDALAPWPNSWLHALLRTPAISCGVHLVDNPVQRLLAPSAGQHVIVKLGCVGKQREWISKS